MPDDFSPEFEPTASSPRPKILCLDDEANVLAALKRQLHRDYEVHVADNARAAIQILMREGPVPVYVAEGPVFSFLSVEFRRASSSMRGALADS